ncbi:MAG: hypothetical protein JO069_18105 [Verrucomicrobia bacterium]|nr:hypothetical protein [Verrucomicrobiota bacterium]
MDLSRIARGRMEVARAPLDLHETVRHAVEVTKPDFDAKRQRLTVTLEAPEHRVHGDARRLQQVFWNLLKNASKFTREQGAIAIRSRSEAGRVVVEVSDTGIGFDAEAAARIFDPFEQADSSVAREFGGLGLGLAISKAAVDAHGGTLRAHSPGKDRGATFTVELPL